METRTWMTTVEVLALSALLLFAPSALLRVALGIPITLHLGWSVISQASAGGRIAGPPPGVGERRRNHRLRYRVVEFLREVKRLEAFARQATTDERSADTAERAVRGTEQRLRDIVGEIVRVAGQSGV